MASPGQAALEAKGAALLGGSQAEIDAWYQKGKGEISPQSDEVWAAGHQTMETKP